MPDEKKLPHIVVENIVETENYLYPGGGGTDKPLPERERRTHAERLLSHLEQVRADAKARREEVQAWAVPAKKGVHVEFESEPGFELDLQSLEDKRKEIQLVAVRPSPEGETAQLATVYVPEGKLGVFEKKIRKYATEDTPGGKPRHRKLVEKIAHIRLATVRSFWTDREDLLPAPDDAIWWEVWLRSRDEQLLDQLRFTLGQLEVEVGDRSLEFPSTRVVLAYGTMRQLSTSVEVVDSIAELRRAKEVPSVFMEMGRLEQREWVDDLLNRIQPPDGEAPRICLLDTGVNAGHPLLEVAIDPEDLHAVKPQWGVADHDPWGHGTGMAGLALFGDLTELLVSSIPVEVAAWLESVKILPPPPEENDPDLYGRITEQAVYRVESSRASAIRTHAMAISATDGRERGKPSSWSAALDKLAYGEDGEPERLWVVAAGNSDPAARVNYPDHLETEEIHDPAQAWNVITVGASTDRWQIDESDFDGWEPVAPAGDLSPSTSTSLTWQPPWPMKPDVVYEGGNAARSPNGREVYSLDSLSLLTTHRDPNVRLLTPFGDTSGACALVARMASQLQGTYPDLWPETIRGLIVHSAEWTPAMRQQVGPRPAKHDYERLIRRCGFGIPSLERARWSADNRLTLIAQETMQPFIRKRGAYRCSLKEIQVFELPWPIQQLRDLADVEVQLRVTLSYFIEPNPSERGYKYRHRYASHGLRFDVRSATESLEEFRKRLNKEAREEDEESPKTGDSRDWTVGSDARHRGSVHSDIWYGSEADLADRQHLAVYPVSGWWKERYSMDRWKRNVRYALIVSIQAPEIEVDLYTPVKTAVEIPIES